MKGQVDQMKCMEQMKEMKLKVMKQVKEMKMKMTE